MQNLEKSMISKLIEIAMEQLKFSYTPYSNFKVGASLLTKNGQIYTGCNEDRRCQNQWTYGKGQCTTCGQRINRWNQK